MQLRQPPRSFLKQVLLVPDERRLRAGWRVLGQTALLLVILGGITTAVFTAAVLLGRTPFLQPLSLLDLVPTAIAVTLSVWVARRLLDRRTVVSLGLQLDRRAPTDVLLGFLIAGSVMGMIYLGEAAAGWLRFDGWAWDAIPTGQVALGMLTGLVAFAVVGWYEELLYRGYYLQNIRDGMGLPWGVFLSSAILAVSHLSNPNVTWYTAVLGLTAAGLFLAYGWIRTRRLWLPIGIHIGWNFFEGSVFGFPVSGIGAAGLIRQTPIGPIALTGGAFGPEAGLIVLPALGIGIGLIWLCTRRRHPAAEA